MKPAPALLSCLLLSLLAASPAAAQAPTLGELWPNDDGHAWDYAQHHETYDPAPQSFDGEVRLWLDGTTVAPGDIAAQYLRQTSLVGVTASFAPSSLPAIADPLLRNLYVARPDLRAAVERLANENPCPLNAPSPRYSLLLTGELAYLKTSGEIAAWRCDLASTRSWQWLVSDLSVGSGFTIQLLPDLASDVVLHGTVGAIEPTTVPAGTFSDCVRVDYVVDYGASACTDASGNVTGTARYETQGWVRYAPGVGPVESSEAFVLAEVTGTCGVAAGTYSATRQQLLSAAVPAAPTTWGRLKVVYR